MFVRVLEVKFINHFPKMNLLKARYESRENEHRYERENEQTKSQYSAGTLTVLGRRNDSSRPPSKIHKIIFKKGLLWPIT